MAPQSLRPGADMGEADESCPVCSTTRYLNKDLEFLISTECYHKMCTSCVDRLLAKGPVPCPTAGCKFTIRRHRFRKPTFSDLKLEKEVDIRREMAKTFNRREEDFENLREYNDYLDKVEDLTFNLINEIDVEETRKQVDEYRKAHLRAIEQNKELEEEGAKAFKEAQKLEEEAAKLRRQAALQEQERERQEQREIERDYLEALQAGGDPDQLAYERSNRLQKAAARTKEAVDAIAQSTAANGALLKGFRKKTKKVEELPPIDPWGGEAHEDDYFMVCNNYPGDRTFANFDRDAKYSAGGYEKQEWYRWALLDAFSGLGVSIEDEMAENDDVGGNIVSAGQAMAVT